MSSQGVRHRAVESEAAAQDVQGFEHEPPGLRRQDEGLLQSSTYSSCSDFFNDVSSLSSTTPLMVAADSHETTCVFHQGNQEQQLATSISGPDGGTTGLLYTIFLIVNAALGAGLLNFPSAFVAAGGVGTALVVQSVLLVFILGALVILAYCADMNNARTLQEAMEAACGPWGRRLTSLCVVVYCFGTTVTFLIIVGDQWDRGLASALGERVFCLPGNWYLHRNFTTAVSAVMFILPLCYSKKIDFLRVPSAMGVFAVIYVVGLIVYEYYAPPYVSARRPPSDLLTSLHQDGGEKPPFKWSDIFYVVPDICFGYQCHVSVIPIYSCLRGRSIPRFVAASFSAVALCAISYTLAGAYGVWTFGDLTAPDILTNYAGSRPEVLAAIAATAFKTFGTYPVLLFCGREALVSLWIDWRRGRRTSIDADDEFVSNSLADNVEEEDESRVESFRGRAMIASTWFGLSLVAAVLVPDIGQVIQMLGSLAAVFIFVIPGMGLGRLAILADSNLSSAKSLVLWLIATVYVALGAFIFGVVITQSVDSILRGDGHPGHSIC